MLSGSLRLSLPFPTLALAAITLVLVGLLSATCFAATRSWDAGGGADTDFTTDANWSSNIEPGASDVAEFDRGAAFDYSVTFPTLFPIPGNITTDRLDVGSNTVTFESDRSTTDYILDNTTTIEADPILGLPVRGITIGAEANDTAAVLVSHLGLLEAVAATLGHATGSSGTLTLNQNNDLLNITGGSSTDAELIVGRLGTGILNVSAGADVTVNGVTGGMFPLPAGGVTLGRTSSGQGTANISGAGSTLVMNAQLVVGEAGTGTLNVTAGGSVEDLSGLIGNLAGSTGTANISGGGSIWSNVALFVGEFGQGTLNITGGGVVESQAARIAGQSGSTSTATLSGAGSAWNIGSGTFQVGLRGHGTLSITDAAHVNSDDSIIGDLAGSQGIVTVSGAGSLWANAAELYVGDAGMGTLEITGGGQVTSHLSSYIAFESSSTGIVTVDGAGSSWTASPSNFYVGLGGDAALEITGGGQVTATGGLSVIAYEAGSNSGVTVDGSGSSWINNHTLVIGYGGVGTLDITGGGDVSNVNGNIGFGPGGTGAVLVDGAGSLWTVTGDLNVGLAGQGTLTVQNGGFVDVDGNVNINTSSTANLQAAAVGGNFSNGGQLNLHIDCMDPIPDPPQDPFPPMEPPVDIGGDLTNDGTFFALFDCMDPAPEPLKAIAVGRSITNNGVFTVTNVDEQDVTIQLGAGETFTNNASGVVNLNGPDDVDSDDTIAAKYVLGANVLNSGQMNVRTNAQVTGSLTTAVNAETVVEPATPCCGMVLDVAGPVTNSGTFSVDTVYEHEVTIQLGPGQTFTNNATGVVNLDGPGDLNGDGMIAAKHIISGNVVSRGQFNIRTNSQIGGSLTVGNGTLTVQNGAAMTSASGHIGDALASAGTVSVIGDGSSWTTTGGLFVGDSGSATLEIKNGAVVSSSSGSLAEGQVSTGIVSVDGAGSTWTVSGDLIVGQRNYAVLEIKGGGHVTSSNGIARANDSDSQPPEIIIDGVGSNWTIANELILGKAGRAALQITDGGQLTSASARIADDAGAVAPILVDGTGSVWTNTGDLVVGNLGDGTLIVQNGAMVAIGGNLSVNSSSTVKLQSATVGGNVVNSGTFTLLTDSASPQLAVELAAGETFTNNATGVLQGTGTIDGNVLNHGQVQPGNSTGVLTIAGDYTQASDGRLVVDVAGTTAGSGYDQLAIGGAIALDGLVEVVFGEGFVPQIGNRFEIITTAEPVNSKFAGASLPGLPAGMDWGIHYDASAVALAISIPGDYSGNGTVDAADYTVWRNSLGQTGVFLAADGDGDDDVDAGDYDFWKMHFGEMAGGGSAGASPSQSAVPEPATLSLVLAALLAVNRMRAFAGLRR